MPDYPVVCMNYVCIWLKTDIKLDGFIHSIVQMSDCIIRITYKSVIIETYRYFEKGNVDYEKKSYSSDVGGGYDVISCSMR